MATNITASTERSCSFEPSVWNDFFIKYEPQPLKVSEESMKEKANKLKVDVQMMFKTFSNTTVEKMTLVDTLQHLGIDHLFEEHIDIALNEIHMSEFSGCSLYEVALRFRLLRERGLWVSPDVFNIFKHENGSFHKDITNDPRGLLSLYNAAYLCVHGEPQLDEAISFARYHLESLRASLKYPLSEEVKRSLEIPLPRTLKRIAAPHYIEEYKYDEACNPSILELAKVDFNLLQLLHQRELKAFCRWGNDLYKHVGLSYSRNRVVECYFWSYTELFEEHYSFARIFLAKLFMLTTMLDDTFDMHATLEEGRKLNEAIQRWDESAIPLLPEYLKKYYVRLMNTFTEFEDELKIDNKYRIVYCRKAFQTLCGHYQQESEWFHSSYMPSFQEHVNCSIMSTGTLMLFIGSLVGMGEEATKEAFEWAMGCTDAVKACGEVSRFMDDMADFKTGKSKFDVASSVESYMHQYNVTSEIAIAALEDMVEDAWKTTNQTRFDRRGLLPLVNRVASITKSMTLLFHTKRDHFTFGGGNKDRIHRQFVEPIPL